MYLFLRALTSRKRTVMHKLTVSTTYNLNAAGELSEGLWLISCTCGFRSSTGFFHTAQKVCRSHLGLPVDRTSTEIEIIGRDEDS